MSNPTLRLGPITVQAAETVAPFRVVALSADGVKHSDGSAAHGVVAYTAAPANSGVFAPVDVAMHITGVIPVETEADFAPGAVVYAGADGKAVAEGTVAIGYAYQAPKGGKVETVLHIAPAESAA